MSVTYRTVTVENQSSLTPKEIQEITIALSIQAQRDFNTSPWVEHGYVPPIHVITLLSAPPAGAWNLIFLDKLPAEVGEGALGFHEDIDGNKIPVSYIGVSECKEDNVSVCEVASHEMCEMAVDPFVNGNDAKFVKHDNKDYILEVADAVQGNGYTIEGQTVADFVWPKWFGLEQTRLNFSQRNSVGAAFTLAPEGYISVRPIGGEWTQVFGDKRTTLPHWASRLPRIHKI